jgi:hypothetical protein
MRPEIYSSQVLVLLLFLCSYANAQDTSAAPQDKNSKNRILFGTNTDIQDARESKGVELGMVGADKKTSKKKEGEGEFAVAPIPMVNPSIGNGAGLAALYAKKLGSEEDSSPPSSFGAGGFGTGNGSWAIGLGAKLYLKNDRYRITFAGGGGKFNYNYFGTGNGSGNAAQSIPLSQRSKAFLIEPKIRVFRDWYLGPRYHIISNDVTLNNPNLDPTKLPVPLPGDLQLRTAALGIRVQRDTSDSTFYPRSGSIFDTMVDFFGSALGGQKTYQSVTISYNKYISAGKKNVFAMRGSTCMATTMAPFYDVCMLGMSKDIRGYQVGQYRDNRMLVGQAEFRRELFWRVGAVAFAGAGAIAHSWDDFGNSQAEPGGGFGLRFVLARRNHINLRADYSWGNGTTATYVSIGEAF